MARTQVYNSATAQFFIMHETASHLDGQYAAFGKVIDGLDVVDKIAAVKTNHHDQPLNDVVIESIKIINGVFDLKPDYL
jgi:peptidyl-prolyl cis-trans isomerase B (cyclophilin B)